MRTIWKVAVAAMVLAVVGGFVVGRMVAEQSSLPDVGDPVTVGRTSEPTAEPTTLRPREPRRGGPDDRSGRRDGDDDRRRGDDGRNDDRGSGSADDDDGDDDGGKGRGRGRGRSGDDDVRTVGPSPSDVDDDGDDEGDDDGDDDGSDGDSGDDDGGDDD